MKTEEFPKIITKNFDAEEAWEIDVYIKNYGYKALEKALKMKPEEIVEEVKKACLRGRGGAGFPAGVKWGLVPKDIKPRYLCVNADEGEPGTFKDRNILERDPHRLIEGIIITCYALGIEKAFIYIRGEWAKIAIKLEKAIKDCEERGFLGKNILKSDFALEIIVHRGAGAYICGEETALMESIEGKRGLPRIKPPFPATKGLFGYPTVINNVETLSNIPSIILNGGEWFASLGVPGDGGTRLFAVSGHVLRPGVYELPVGTKLSEIIFKWAGGIREGKSLKAVFPGGISAPILTAEEVDTPADFNSLQKIGSMLGSGAIVVIADSTVMTEVLDRVIHFFHHESCGQCTPCREGTSILKRKIKKILNNGNLKDIREIEEIGSRMIGKCLCPLGDACGLQVKTIVNKFRKELEDYVEKNKEV
ncbi:MAG: NADH-quinone oxidoreductase subunit NuoF [Candidatus Aminicenantia bacterium]